jgi:hypothetical protein
MCYFNYCQNSKNEQKEVITIIKKIVLKTNKNDIKYLFLNNKSIKHYQNILDDNDKKLFIKLYSYVDIDNKKLNIYESIDLIEVVKLKKLGVKRYNKKDFDKNTYRVKFTKKGEL